MDLTSQVNEILRKYAGEVDQVVLEVEEKVAKEAIKKLKATSPKAKRNGGHRHYADDWKEDNKSKKQYAHHIIYNKQYQLTHLLENGHNIVSHGKVVGHARPQKHIKPVEEWVKSEVEKEIRRGLE